jgi:hypothetical protein
MELDDEDVEGSILTLFMLQLIRGARLLLGRKKVEDLLWFLAMEVKLPVRVFFL